MYNEKIEELIKAALADGVLTEKEKQILFKKAQAEGIDLDEFEMVLDARLVEYKKAEKEKSTASAPKSNKFGDVRKCPVCGAIAQAYQAKCPECGYEFTNVDANLSSQKLADLVLNAKTESGRERCITLFPIPNTKADLLEFLTSLQPRMRDIEDPLSRAYFKKYQECIAKAQVSFSSDPLLAPFIESFASEEKTIKKNRRIAFIKRWVKNNKGMTVGIIVALIVAILFIVSLVTAAVNADETNNPDLCAKAIAKAIDKDDLQYAQKLIDNYQYQSHNICNSYVALCTAYLDEGDVESAKELVDRYIQDGNSGDDALKVKSPLYKYFINCGLYDDAEQYIPTKYSTIYNDDYYGYMKDCVEEMCRNGKTKEAKKFVKRKSVFFSDEPNSSEFCKTKVVKNFNSVIDAY